MKRNTSARSLIRQSVRFAPPRYPLTPTLTNFSKASRRSAPEVSGVCERKDRKTKARAITGTRRASTIDVTDRASMVNQSCLAGGSLAWRSSSAIVPAFRRFRGFIIIGQLRSQWRTSYVVARATTLAFASFTAVSSSIIRHEKNIFARRSKSRVWIRTLSNRRSRRLANKHAAFAWKNSKHGEANAPRHGREESRLKISRKASTKR